MIKTFLHKLSSVFVIVFVFVNVVSCIEPPLKLPAQEVLVDMPLVQVDMDVVWNLDIDVNWEAQWHYGWDATDMDLWGETDYPTPTNFEVRRYYLGDAPGQAHKSVDGFTIYGESFRRTYEFGYYDMLLWSNIDSEDHTQVLVIDESELDTIHASTTVTHGLTRIDNQTQVSNFSLVTGSCTDNSVVTALFNQPEIFYAAYPQDVYISRFKEDYDYYDEVEQCWVKKLNCVLVPRVYIYLVQVILKNNHSGRIKDVSGDNALSNMAAGTSVNDGHTWNMPVSVYFGTRMKRDMDYNGETVDIIGGKFTTFGLCDLPAFETNDSPIYAGSRTDLANDLFIDLVFNNGSRQTLQIDVTDQVRKQSHGGIITVIIDGNEVPDPPSPETGGGSLFVPTVEDYDEVIYDIIM